MSTEFLEPEDEMILQATLKEFGVGELGWYRFWGSEKLQLDGDFSANDLRALVTAMERMAARKRTA